MSGAMGLGAEPIAAESKAGETDHFWYRLQPAGPYIDSQRDNKAFGREEGAIVLSEDNGRTWPHSAAFPDARHITFSRILKNGNIVFATEHAAVPQHRQPENVQAHYGQGCQGG